MSVSPETEINSATPMPITEDAAQIRVDIIEAPSSKSTEIQSAGTEYPQTEKDHRWANVKLFAWVPLACLVLGGALGGIGIMIVISIDEKASTGIQVFGGIVFGLLVSSVTGWIATTALLDHKYNDKTPRGVKEYNFFAKAANHCILSQARSAAPHRNILLQQIWPYNKNLFPRGTLDIQKMDHETLDSLAAWYGTDFGASFAVSLPNRRAAFEKFISFGAELDELSIM